MPMTNENTDPVQHNGVFHMKEDQTPPDFRCGYVTIIGEPNVGKSTLMNRFLQQKISIVTHKPQTTRHRVLGILSTSSTQIIFLDTPGIIAPRYALHEAMMEHAAVAINDADVLLFMVDATKRIPDAGNESEAIGGEAFEKVKSAGRRTFLVVNKIDSIDEARHAPVLEYYQSQFTFQKSFAIAALRGTGTDELLASITVALPVHPPYYPLDVVSEHPERFFVAEIIREKIFLQYQEEIPYSTTVEIREFRERENGKWLVDANIYVERDSQKGILIGKGGNALKEIGKRARKDIETFLQHPIYLQLFVKVRKEWRDDPKWVDRLGYKAKE